MRISLDTYFRGNPSKRTPYGYELPVDLKELIETIIVHPDSLDWFMDVIKSIVGKYKVNVLVKRGEYGKALSRAP